MHARHLLLGFLMVLMPGIASAVPQTYLGGGDLFGIVTVTAEDVDGNVFINTPVVFDIDASQVTLDFEPGSEQISGLDIVVGETQPLYVIFDNPVNGLAGVVFSEGTIISVDSVPLTGSDPFYQFVSLDTEVSANVLGLLEGGVGTVGPQSVTSESAESDGQVSILDPNQLEVFLNGVTLAEFAPPPGFPGGSNVEISASFQFVAVVPEPNSVALVAVGAILIGSRLRRSQLSSAA